MGADLLLHVLAVERERKLDWLAGEKYLAELPASEVEAAGAESVDDLLEGLRQLRAYFDGETDDRITVRLGMGPLALFIHGDRTWGDSPSELFEQLDRLSQTDVLDHVGFVSPDGLG